MGEAGVVADGAGTLAEALTTGAVLLAVDGLSGLDGFTPPVVVQPDKIAMAHRLKSDKSFIENCFSIHEAQRNKQYRCLLGG
jgi:hypothetical protein